MAVWGTAGCSLTMPVGSGREQGIRAEGGRIEPSGNKSGHLVAGIGSGMEADELKAEISGAQIPLVFYVLPIVAYSQWTG